MLTPQQIQAIAKQRGDTLQPQVPQESSQRLQELHSLVSSEQKQDKPGYFQSRIVEPVKGFVSDVAGSVKERGANITSELERGITGESGFKEGIVKPLESGVRIGSELVGLGGDILGAGAKATYKSPVGDVVTFGQKGNIEEQFNKFVQHPKVQQAIKQIAVGAQDPETLLGKYNQFKDTHPEAAKDLESLLNIALAVPVGGESAVVTKGLGEAGEATVRAGVGALEKGATGIGKLAENTAGALGGATEGMASSGVVQKGKELLERVPRAKMRAQEALAESALKAEKLKTASPATKEAIKSNLNEALVNTISEADKPTLEAYKEMSDIASETKKTLGVKTRPEIVAGKRAVEQYKLIDKERKNIGSQIGTAVEELSKTTKVPMQDSRQAIDSVLSNEGVTAVMDENGVRLDFSGSRYTPAERSKIKELYNLAMEGGDEMTPAQIHRKDNLFSKLQREARFEGVGDIIVKTPEGDKNLFSVFRDLYSNKLEEHAPQIKSLNKKYRDLINLQNDIEDSIIKTGSYDQNKAKDLAEFAQTNLRRLGSDAQSAAAYREIAEKMDTTARKLGYKGAHPGKLIDFATEMRRLFPETIPPTSFQGGIRTSLSAMAEKIIEAGAPNLTDQQKALKSLLKEALEKGLLLK